MTKLAANFIEPLTSYLFSTQFVKVTLTLPPPSGFGVTCALATTLEPSGDSKSKFVADESEGNFIWSGSETVK